MSEEELNMSGEQTEEAAVPAGDAGSYSQPEQSAGDDVQQNEQSVPLAALQSEREKRQSLQDELRLIKEHIALMQANQSQSQEKPKDEFDSLEDTDVMTVGEFRKISKKMANQFNMTIEELKMVQKHPDYQEVITKYLPDLLKQNPGLQQSLQKTQDYELAYYLAKNSDAYRSETRKSKKSADAQRIVENSQKAGSLSSMGSTSPISQARRYKDMDDREFEALVNRNMGGI